MRSLTLPAAGRIIHYDPDCRCQAAPDGSVRSGSGIARRLLRRAVRRGRRCASAAPCPRQMSSANPPSATAMRGLLPGSRKNEITTMRAQSSLLNRPVGCAPKTVVSVRSISLADAACGRAPGAHSRLQLQDSYIGATARWHGLTIDTGNDRDFRRPDSKCLIPAKNCRNQKIAFSPACKFLGVPAELITPKAGAPTCALGAPNAGVFVALKASARNCSRSRSVILKPL
jgi:hypothetical protein